MHTLSIAHSSSPSKAERRVTGPRINAAEFANRNAVEIGRPSDQLIPRLCEIGRRGDQTAEDLGPQANKRQDNGPAA